MPTSRSLAHKLHDFKNLDAAGLCIGTLPRSLRHRTREHPADRRESWLSRNQIAARLPDEFLTFFERVTAKEGSACARAQRTLDPVVAKTSWWTTILHRTAALPPDPVFEQYSRDPVHAFCDAPPAQREDDGCLEGRGALIADSIIFHRACEYSTSDDKEAILFRSRQTIEESHRAMQRADQALMRPRQFARSWDRRSE